MRLHTLFPECVCNTSRLDFTDILELVHCCVYIHNVAVSRQWLHSNWNHSVHVMGLQWCAKFKTFCPQNWHELTWRRSIIMQKIQKWWQHASLHRI